MQFFWKCSKDGPVGVFAEILMFGVINIGFLLLGFLIWRNFYHISTIRNVIAGFLAIPIISLILSLNLFLAHYRDKLESFKKSNLSIDEMNVLFSQIGSQARESFLNNSFMLDDFKSYLLMFIGIIASIFAIIKSFQLDDPYPGYGKISREQSKLANFYNNEQTSAFREMDDLADDFSNQINEQLARLQGNETAVISGKMIKTTSRNITIGYLQSVGWRTYTHFIVKKI